MNASAIRRPQQPAESTGTNAPLRVIPGGKATTAEKRAARNARRARPKFHYAFIVMLGVALVLGGQLLMSIVLAQSAYEISALKTELREASRTAESLGEDIALLSSPQYLASNATSLGMVPSKQVAFMRLSDGSVAGSLAVAGNTNAIANPQVTNSLLEREASYLSGVLNLTQPAGTFVDETPFGGTSSAGSAEVSSSEASRGLAPVAAESLNIPVLEQ